MSQVDVKRLREIAESEFADIVVEVLVPDINELRIILMDGSFVDVWFSLKLVGRYSFHWERRAIDGRIHRHDNAPHKRWQFVRLFLITFITAVKARWWRAISAMTLQMPCGNSSPLRVIG